MSLLPGFEIIIAYEKAPGRAPLGSKIRMPRASGTSLESLSPFQPHCTQIDCFRDSSLIESVGLSVKAAAGACLALTVCPAGNIFAVPGTIISLHLILKDLLVINKFYCPGNDFAHSTFNAVRAAKR